MRGAQLLSPHRARRGAVRAHDGRIETDAPDVMWGTDGTRVETAEEGSGVDLHRRGALERRGDGLARHPEGRPLRGGRGAAQGLSLRMDHGTQYTSEHFLNELRFWSLTPGFGYVAEPETNGVAERFNRTLKAQVIRGRVFRDAAELRAAVGGFIDRYNASLAAGEERLPEPHREEGTHPGTIGGIAKLLVQITGCDSQIGIGMIWRSRERVRTYSSEDGAWEILC